MKVLLADDRGLLLEELRGVLRSHGIELAGVAKDASECVRQARRLRPDVILMDSRMPSRAVLTATRGVMAELPETRVLILTASVTGYDLFEAVRSGPSGFLLKSIEGGHLLDVLNAIHARRSSSRPLERQAAMSAQGTVGKQGSRGRPLVILNRDAAARAPCQQWEPLSDRQEEVLTLLAQGLSYKEIGDKVALTARTVKYHVGEIMRKLNLRNRAQVVAYGGSRGLGAQAGRDESGESLPPCVLTGVCPFGH